MLKRQAKPDETVWDRGKIGLAGSEAKWRIGEVLELSDAVKRELRGVEIVREALGIERDSEQKRT